MKTVDSKILILIFSAMAIFALSGCGSSGTSSNDQLVDGTPVVAAPYTITAHHDSTAVVHSHVDPATSGTHSWTQVSGPTISLTTPTGPTVTLVVPTGVTTPIVLSHTHTNAQTGQTTSTHHTVSPIPATIPLSVVVSKPVEVVSGTVASLHASASGGDGQYTYVWTQIGGTHVSLDPTHPSAPTFVAPTVTTRETLSFNVEVTDGQGDTASATETITVLPVSGVTPPVCDAGVGLLTQQQPSLFEHVGKPMVSDYGSAIARGDTFTIQSADPLVHIGSIEWWGWYSSPTSTDTDFLDDFTLEIYEFDNGVPKIHPLYSIHIGDIIEDAVFTREGVIHGNSGHDQYWINAWNLGSGDPLFLHRYEALFFNNPIELESGKKYLLSIVNNKPDGGFYNFTEPYPAHEPEFYVDDWFVDLAWSWARVNHELDDQVSSWERKTGDNTWNEIATTPGSNDPYNPDLAFSLYDCAGNVDPIIYLAVDSVYGDSVYRISNLKIGNNKYNIKFKRGVGSNMHGDLEFTDTDAAITASDAINALLNAKLPSPPTGATATNDHSLWSKEQYYVPYFTTYGEAVAVENAGPGLYLPNTPAPWFTTVPNAFIPASTDAMYTDFILLEKDVK